MAYQFQNKPTASFQYSTTSGNDRAFTISQISGTNNDATTMAKGMAGLFWIVNEHEDWNAAEGTRTLKQTMVESE